MYPYNYPAIKCKETMTAFPPQHQPFQPGVESLMKPQPVSENPEYAASGKLRGKVAVITGGDSGIGRAVAIAFAKEGAHIVIVYLAPYERGDAMQTKRRVEQIGGRCLLIECDLTDENCCKYVVQQTIRVFGRIDILVNNAGVHYVDKSIEDISAEQLETTFQTNIISYFNLTKEALPYMTSGSAIINTASVTAYEPYDLAIDYAATKGAVVAFTRSLAKSLVSRGIRVNAVAPGMTWTPLIPASIPADDVVFFGRNRPMGRAAQPWEIAPSYVFLASESDSSYITGQTIIVS